MLISHKVFVAMSAWTAGSVYVALSYGADLFVTLALIGLLVTRELSDSALDRGLRRRIGLFVFVLLAAFAVVVANRVMEVLD